MDKDIMEMVFPEQYKSVDGRGGGGRGAESPPDLRFVLSNNIAVPCILRGEYLNTCIYASQPPHSYKLVYAPAIRVIDGQ